MRRLLVLTGTTPFRGLENYAIDLCKSDECELLIQTRRTIHDSNLNGRISKKNWIEISDEIIGKFDLILSHCGAGIVFENLNKNLPILIIPNEERTGSIQQGELGKFLEINGYMQVIYLNQLRTLNLSELLNLVKHFKPNYYSSEQFFLGEKIINYLKGNTSCIGDR